MATEPVVLPDHRSIAVGPFYFDIVKVAAKAPLVLRSGPASGAPRPRAVVNFGSATLVALEASQGATPEPFVPSYRCMSGISVTKTRIWRKRSIDPSNHHCQPPILPHI